MGQTATANPKMLLPIRWSGGWFFTACLSLSSHFISCPARSSTVHVCSFALASLETACHALDPRKSSHPNAEAERFDPMPRRTHKKSRNGCQQCKQRHIKVSSILLAT